VDELLNDPRPDGNHKLKLVSRKVPTYRIRAGMYRVIYTFDSEWVWLFAVRKRDVVYDGDIQTNATDGGSSPEPPPLEEEDLDAPEETPPPPHVNPTVAVKDTQPPPPGTPRSLPTPITLELLVQLRVPPEFRPALLDCADEEALLQTVETVPHPFGQRVMDAIFPPSIDTVECQGDLVLSDTASLVAFNEGFKELKVVLPPPGSEGPAPGAKPVAILVDIPRRDIVSPPRPWKKILIGALLVVVVALIVWWVIHRPPPPPPPPTHPSPTHPDSMPVIPADEAGKYEGKRITVEMTVAFSNQMDKDPKMTFLNSRRERKDEKNLAVVISPESAAKFHRKGIDNPATHFRGKTIRVTGTVERYKGQLEMKIDDPDQVKIVGQDK
jgi:hypothetical protein